MASPPSPTTLKSTSPLSPISPWPPLVDPDDLTAESSAKPPQQATTLQSPVDSLPTSKEIYGSIAVVLTTLGYLVYLTWAFLPASTLHSLGWTWYPSQDWATIIPCWLMLLVLTTFSIYAGMTAFLTPSFDQPNLITDSHSAIPPLESGERYYWKGTNKSSMPPTIDMPIDFVNRVLYPPRPRQIHVTGNHRNT